MKLRGLIPNFYIHVSVSNLYINCMYKLGTRPRSFISGNICFEFSVQCICSVVQFQEHYIILPKLAVGQNFYTLGKL